MRRVGTGRSAAGRRLLGAAWVVVALSMGLVACGGGADAAPGAVVIQGEDMASATLPQAAQATGTDRLIVRLNSQERIQQYTERAAEFERSLSAAAGLDLQVLRQTRSGSFVLGLSRMLTAAQAADVAQRVARRADVLFAEPDHVLQADVWPNDPQFNEQWALAGSGQWPGAVRLPAAWTLGTGAPAVVVAVLDNGVLPHADLAGRLLPGYDFVSHPQFGNDGDGRDGDPSDPGDWLTGGESWVPGAAARHSNWHGTHVAGILAAQANNGLGMAGVDWQARVLPVRVLGRGGGYVSDIADGLQWAVGASVPDVPPNPTPARVVNMSLGGGGSCSRELQSALDEARSRRAVVVASAGNSAQDVSNTMLASCRHLLAVAATGRKGELSPYSNHGAAIALAAPGGNYPSDSGIVSLGDSGITVPRRDHTYTRKQGTSMAAPLVAGVASLMLAANPGLSPADVTRLLLAAARPFPTGTANDCTVSRCGAGILDAAAAVSLAALHPAAPTLVVQAVGETPAWPASGLWQSAEGPTRLVAVDVQGASVGVSVYFYDGQGRPTWAQARLGYNSGANAFVGRLFSHEGGATLTGPFQAPAPARDWGAITLSVPGPSQLVFKWPGGQTLLSPQLTGSTDRWWMPSRPGNSYVVTVADTRMSVLAQAYAEDGQPTWYRADLLRGDDGRYRGGWVSSALAGAAHTPVTTPLSGSDAEWHWVSGVAATLRMLDGSLQALQAGASAEIDPREQSERLLGLWRADYTVAGRAGSERWTLATLTASEAVPGDYNVGGVNQWGGWMLGGWSSRYANFSLFAPGLLFDDFYVFDFAGDTRAGGCYHLYFLALEQLSDCHPLSAERQGSAADALAAPGSSGSQVVGDRRKEAGLLGRPVFQLATVAEAGIAGPASKAQSAAPLAATAALQQLQGWQQAAARR